MVEGSGPGLADEDEELAGDLARLVVVEHEWRGLLLEEAEGAFDVGLVLCPAAGGADEEGRAKGLVDLGGVVGWTVVEEKGDGGLGGGTDTVGKRAGDGGAVLLVSDIEAHEGTGVGVDGEFEIEGEAVTGEPDWDGSAVSDPLCTGEEGFELVSEGLLVG